MPVLSALKTSQQLLAENARRTSAVIINQGDTALFLNLGTGNATLSMPITVAVGDSYTVPAAYTGAIQGIWALGLLNADPTGSATVEEVLSESSCPMAVYAKSISKRDVTYACLVKLSDTVNWGHEETGRIRLLTQSLTMTPPPSAEGSALVCVVLETNPAESKLGVIYGRTFDATGRKGGIIPDLQLFRSFDDAQDLRVENGLMPYFTTRSIFTDSDLTNATSIDSAAIAANGDDVWVTPEVGDLLARIDRKGDDTPIAPAFQVQYYTEAS